MPICPLQTATEERMDGIGEADVLRESLLRPSLGSIETGGLCHVHAMPAANNALPSVSIVMAIHNAAPFLSDAIEGILSQTYAGPLEYSAYNDASTDESAAVVVSFLPRFTKRGISVRLGGAFPASLANNNDIVGFTFHPTPSSSSDDASTMRPKGVGGATNQAIAQSSGECLCIADADDIMLPRRVEAQVVACMRNASIGDRVIVGCNFTRIPEGSTDRYTRWLNSIDGDSLYSQRFVEVTLIKPSWMLTRCAYELSGPFDEGGRGVPEDLIFFNSHVESGGLLCKATEELLVYRYHENAATHAVTRETLWDIRMDAVQRCVIDAWVREHGGFTIWSNGKEGRKFYRSLSENNRNAVRCFCDVDAKKIGRGVYEHIEGRVCVRKVPVVHFDDVAVHPPIVVCVKMDLTGGAFEQIFGTFVEARGLVEGRDYLYFS